MAAIGTPVEGSAGGENVPRDLRERGDSRVRGDRIQAAVAERAPDESGLVGPRGKSTLQLVPLVLDARLHEENRAGRATGQLSIAGQQGPPLSLGTSADVVVRTPGTIRRIETDHPEVTGQPTQHLVRPPTVRNRGGPGRVLR